jgi:pimeloyl-ACP methyl ester carboxylesterase
MTYLLALVAAIAAGAPRDRRRQLRDPLPRRLGGGGMRSLAMRVLARVTVFLVAILACIRPGYAKVEKFPAGMQISSIPVDGARIYVRSGGRGPAVLLLHGFGDTGDMWAPVARELIKNHTVIVPDLRGIGSSSYPARGYEKKKQAEDMIRVLDALKIKQADLVTHDIGNMVGYALAAQNPDRITRWVIIDAPLPGIGPWDEILKSPLLWHFNFRGPDVDRLVKGRERIYLDRFWNELSANPKAIDEATRRHYATIYARPGAMHAAFEQFAAFSQDAKDNQAFLAKAKLAMPILALGAERSFGAQQAEIMRFVGTNVEGGIIANSGHWVMEEQPQSTVKAITEFLDRK